MRRRDAIESLLIVGITSWVTAGCAQETVTSPTPTPQSNVVAPAPPGHAPMPLTLSGRVTEAEPTTIVGLANADVTLTDGTNTWKSTPTVGGDGRGQYMINGLRGGRFQATATAQGFVSSSREITVPADASTDFALLPVPQTKHFTFRDQIAATDGTCSDGAHAWPCRVAAVPIHNAGPLAAALRWTSATPTMLTVTLFEKGRETPIAKSTFDGTAQRISGTLSGGALYELRVTYVSGTDTAAYAMSVDYQN